MLSLSIIVGIVLFIIIAVACAIGSEEKQDKN